MFVCLAMVSLTCSFLMCQFDHNTGLIKFNLFVWLFPNNAFTWCLVFVFLFCFNILALLFSLNKVLLAVILKCAHSPDSPHLNSEFVSKKKIQAIVLATTYQK